MGTTGDTGEDRQIHPERMTVRQLLGNLSEERLREFVADLAQEVPGLREHIDRLYAGYFAPVDLEEKKREIDQLVVSHRRDGRMDDWFLTAFSDLCRKQINALTAGRHYDEAFDLTCHVYELLAGMPSESDTDIFWKEDILVRGWGESLLICTPPETFERAREWFVRHRQDHSADPLVDHLREAFDERQMADPDELKARLRELDEIIDAAKDQEECPPARELGVFNRPAWKDRLAIMERLGCSAQEIHDWRMAHRHFRGLRQELLTEAEKKNDQESLRLLLPKVVEKDERWLSAEEYRHYTLLLADLYHESGDRWDEISARARYFVRCIELEEPALLESFLAVKRIYPAQDWEENMRWSMIDVLEDPGRRCALLAEEGLTDALLKEILRSEDEELLERYRALLVPEHERELVKIRVPGLERMAESARSSRAYAALARELEEAASEPGGKEMVSALAKQWIRSYPNRKGMARELERFVM